ncbi:MAG: glycosyltransferase family 1 protein [Candidatus Cloacimonadota bacterium]|nr:MAG: glycosyltransferase family 1 protein [Candidatus Cloacimonadota bacterium]
MKKTKILHIQLLPLLSGVQNVMLSLITHLPSSKYEFTVLSAPNGPLIEKLNQLNIESIVIRELRRKINWREPIVFYKIYKLCKDRRFDIVHTHSSKTGFLGRIAANLAKVPFIVHTIHGFPFHPYQNKLINLCYKELERIAGHFCDIVVSVNKYERDLSIKEKIIPEEKIITIYNGISEESFGKWNNFNDNGKNIDLKDKFGITDDSIIIGSVSRFSTQKNIIALAKAAIKIVAKNRGIKFVLIGDGPLYNDVRRLVIQAKSMDRILLPGWQTNIRQWLLVMDIFVLYSLWEGLSISILEAMAVGKPIIASNIKGNNELVIDRENGFLVPIHQNNENMLINKILTLAKNETLIESMGKRSKELVKEKFSIQQFVDAYDKVYQMLK